MARYDKRGAQSAAPHDRYAYTKLDPVREACVRRMVVGSTSWPYEDRLHMKKLIRPNNFSHILRDVADAGVLRIRSHCGPLTFASMEALIAEGWAVD